MLRVAIALAYRQLLHRGAKLIGALTGVSVAIVLMFIQLGFQGALYDSAVGAARNLDADIVIANYDFQTAAFSPPWMPMRLLREALSVEGVASASPFYATTVRISNPSDGRHLTTWLFAFNPDAPVFVGGDINSQLDLIRLPRKAIIDAKSRKQNGDIAEQVRQTGRVDVVMPLFQMSVQPVLELEGVYEIGPTIDVDGSIIMSDLNYYSLIATPLDRVSLGIVRVAEGYVPEDVQRAIRQRLGSAARVFLKQEYVKNERDYIAKDTPIGFVFNLGLAVGVVVGIVFVSQVLHGIVSDNMREYATLRAIGYKQGFFVILVGAIAIAIAIITYLPSTLASYFVYQFTAEATKLPMQMKVSYMIEVFLLVLVMGLAATFLSSRKLKQADPVDLF
jgi:putative ABC transport system permease protein